jgi:hypothetical protein
MRWKDELAVKLAFEGEKDRLRFVSTRPAGATKPGIALVGISLEDGKDFRQRDLVMRRALPPVDAKDFSALGEGDRTVLMPGVERAEFTYFGTDNDLVEGKWQDEWPAGTRIPQLVRLRLTLQGGVALPEFVVAMHLGEEAGCFENSFQRQCGPRR